MIGQKWNSEIRKFKDEKTGRTIKQLTTVGNNVHLYFTENSFTAGKNEIIFRSDRASGEDMAPHDEPLYNLFKMDLDTGEMVQLTDETDSIHHITKTRDSQVIVYIAGNTIKKYDPVSGEVLVVYEETGNFSLSAASIARNRRYIGFGRNEIVDAPRGPNYSGFKESFYRIKDGRVTLAYLDGSGAVDIHKDTHWVGHFQFCPDDSTLATFCHEGPWNLVTQRMWFLDIAAHTVQPCFRQTEQDSIGHEFWTQDGYVFFDDRGPNHDGTITSDRTQAVVTDIAVNQNEMIPFVGLVDRNGSLIKKIDMPYYCNHYHANIDNTILVGDDVDNLVLINIAGAEATIETLCNHKTSWHTQSSHCHPTWDWDGSRILYASDHGGKVNLYIVEP